MPEVRSLCLIVAALLDADSVRWRPPFRPSRPPFRLRAKTGRLQPGMGGRLQTESVVAFERNGWSPWTGIRNAGRAAHSAERSIARDSGASDADRADRRRRRHRHGNHQPPNKPRSMMTRPGGEDDAHEVELEPPPPRPTPPPLPIR